MASNDSYYSVSNHGKIIFKNMTPQSSILWVEYFVRITV